MGNFYSSLLFCTFALYLKPTMKNSINGFKRKLQVAQGAYDGRFISKRVEDKKKVASKRACRKKVSYF